MEHPCHQCGAIVEDGQAFCRQCNAPQIRVVTEVPDELPPAPSDILSASGPSPVLLAGSIQWSRGLPAAGWAGVLTALSLLAPAATLGLGALTGGALAVFLYRRRAPGSVLSAGQGAKLGAVTGAIGFGIFMVIAALRMSVFGGWAQFRSLLIQAVETAAARSGDPQVQASMNQFKSPEGLVVLMVAIFCVQFVFCLCLTTVGGALGVWLLKNRR